MRRLSHVHNLVNCQSARLAEALATIRAFVRLVLRVDVLVVPQVVLAPEGLATDVTREGALVRVGSFVDEKVVALGELTVTIFADEPFLGARAATGARVEARVQGGEGGGGGEVGGGGGEGGGGGVQPGGLAQPLPHEEGLGDLGQEEGRGEAGEEGGGEAVEGREEGQGGR